MDGRNVKARNFGLKSRDIVTAARNALVERGASFSSVATNTARFGQFATFLRAEFEIKDLRWIEKDHLVAYAEHLAEEVEAEAISNKYAHNLLSAVNIVLQQARGDSLVRVNPSDHLANRSGIATVSRAHPDIVFEQTKTSLSAMPDGGRLSAAVSLQRELGLRFEESIKANPRSLLTEALRSNSVRITDGTKGGRIRLVPITSHAQIAALRAAADAQRSGRSLIPQELNYRQFRSLAYRAIAKTAARQFHGFRHAYAQARYREITGVDAPVVAGIPHGVKHHRHMATRLNCSISDARAIDRRARLIVAEELGHGRIEVTNAYLG